MMSSHMMSLNVRPSDECRRRLSGRRDGELDMGQRRPAEPLLESGILKFLSSKRNALCVALSFESLSLFV